MEARAVSRGEDAPNNPSSLSASSSAALHPLRQPTVSDSYTIRGDDAISDSDSNSDSYITSHNVAAASPRQKPQHPRETQNQDHPIDGFIPL